MRRGLDGYVFGFAFVKERRGQGAFEYILMLAGLMLVVLLILVVLQGTAGGQQQGIARTVCYQDILKDPSCRFSNGTYNPGVIALTLNSSNCYKTTPGIWNCSNLPTNLRPQ